MRIFLAALTLLVAMSVLHQGGIVRWEPIYRLARRYPGLAGLALIPVLDEQAPPRAQLVARICAWIFAAVVVAAGVWSQISI